ncbi:MAG TPA: sigma-70 family RNA polymerase sigma factor [Gemmataceae bacterium]|jgi:RNA polymerase sigma-70 factor (ECF subfamily)|nr:sigma-70 family RNA polymerase sigma factor [Gemmataceae bacterium]
MGQPPDDPLIVGLAQGREDAFVALYDRFADSLFRFAHTLLNSKEDAEDVVQEVFVSLVRSRNSLAQVDNLRAYLFTSLRNAVTQHARRRKPIQAVSLERIEEPVDPKTPSTTGDRSFELEQALQRLPFEQRELVALKIDGELTFAEIAEVLNISPNTAASRYRYALEKLREVLKE